jgi:hypothetical protein
MLKKSELNKHCPLHGLWGYYHVSLPGQGRKLRLSGKDGTAENGQRISDLRLRFQMADGKGGAESGILTGRKRRERRGSVSAETELKEELPAPGGLCGIEEGTVDGE